MCFDSSGGDSASGDSRQLEEERRARINEGMASIDNTFAPFNSDYYTDFENKYRNLGIPDVASQFRDAMQKSRFSLARAGNLDSSAAGQTYKDLAQRNNQALLKVSDDARTASAQQRGAIEGARSSLTSQLSATENPSAVAQAAVNQAAVLSKPPTYSPITDIFANVTGALASNEAARRWGNPGLGFDLAGPYPRGNKGSVTQIS